MCLQAHFSPRGAALGTPARPSLQNTNLLSEAKPVTSVTGVLSGYNVPAGAFQPERGSPWHTHAAFPAEHKPALRSQACHWSLEWLQCACRRTLAREGQPLARLCRARCRTSTRSQLQQQQQPQRATTPRSTPARCAVPPRSLQASHRHTKPALLYPNRMLDVQGSLSRSHPQHALRLMPL